MTATRETPKTIAQAAEIVRRTRDAGKRLIPVGAGSKLHWLDDSPHDAVLLDMRSCDGIVEYTPDDMTVTVEAGILLAALQARLAERGQRLTLDPPRAATATVGGVLASNDSGPIRFAWGTARDIVIGMSMIEPDGTLIKSGGRVVKNVAGYDLHKLYIGSQGTLGPIATATFKLRPVPEALGLVVAQPDSAADAERMMADLLAGETRPTLIELFNGRMAAELALSPKLSLAVGFEENREAVAWQCQQAVAAIGGIILGEKGSRELYERLREAPAAGADTTAFKATMLSSHVAGFVERADALPLRLIAHAGNGVVHGICTGPIDAADWRRLLDDALAGEGNLQVRGPLPAGVSRRGAPREDAFLTAAVQKAFDPAGTFVTG